MTIMSKIHHIIIDIDSIAVTATCEMLLELGKICVMAENPVMLVREEALASLSVE
jgi:hypothetical protein